MMWWTKALSIASGVGSFLNPYKLLIVGGLLAGAVTYVGIHIANDNTRDVKLKNAVKTEARLEKDLTAQRAKVKQANDRIARINIQQIEALQVAAEKIKKAEDQAIVLRAKMKVTKEELEMTRFNLVEAIRDDEDFAEWVDWSFPLAGRSLLFNATKGRTPGD